MWFRIGSGVVFEFPDWFWTGFIFQVFVTNVLRLASYWRA
jgi:hypothetical protein